MNGEGLDLTPQEIEEIKKRRANMVNAKEAVVLDVAPLPVEELPARCCGKCLHGVEEAKEFVCAAMPPVTMVITVYGPSGAHDEIMSSLTFTKKHWPACARFTFAKPRV